MKIEQATREDKEAFAESFASAAPGEAGQAGDEGSVQDQPQEGDETLGAAVEGQDGSGTGAKKKRGRVSKASVGAGAGKRGRGKRAAAKAREAEHSPVMEFDPALTGYPTADAVEEETAQPVAETREMQVDVATTLQEGLDRELATTRPAEIESAEYGLVLPQETTLLAAAEAAAAAEEETVNGAVSSAVPLSTSSPQTPVASTSTPSKRLRPLALNPDKDGLPRPRPKSFLMLRPDGSIVPTSQRQLRAEAKRKGEVIDSPSGSTSKKRRRVQPVEHDEMVNLGGDDEDEVIRALGAASADVAAAEAAQQHGESAANMFLRDTEDPNESLEVGDQDSAMVLAMMGDSAQMMRLMQQQAGVGSSSASSLQQQQQQQGGMGTYGPPPGTTHGQHAQMLLQQQLRHQRGEESGRTANEQIMELYQVTGPDFGQAVSRTGPVSAGGLRPGSVSGAGQYDLDRSVTSSSNDSPRHLVGSLGRNVDAASNRDEPDPQQLFNNFQMLNPYISAAQDLAYRPASGDGQHDDVTHFDPSDDLVVSASREDEGDEAEIDVEGEMNAIGQFAEHIGGNEREEGENGM